jgi:4-hydroxybenzoate polyprenyltransferase
MFRTIGNWLEFVKFSHTIFALPFALASMALAARDNRGWPGLRTFLLIVGAMVCARTAAMAFNRIADRQFDARNPRTAQRHLPAGKISIISALVLFAVAASGLVVDSFFINPICFYLSPVALIVVCFYSLALAPIGAWLAVKGNFALFPTDNGSLALGHSAILPLLLAVAVVFWLIGFDIIYALQDYEFDRQHGLRSLVVRWGPKNALGAAFLSHLVMWGILMAFGLFAGFRLAYYIAGGFILLCLIAEHWLARRRSLNWVNNAFFRLNAVISIVFLVATLTEICFPFFRMR